ncbi:tyrosine-type recombinase/integrase [Microbacterium sp. Sa1CUA4]|uniref:Tyrosine-type recombinase/integrase n=1 Tax=Microbacterium gallinarum TaxID=2762209 RepID=A0ABR8X3E2_9MICO|nr:tyrosine-type recombinase/integrase [Microbacterium gallinarum]
MAGAAWEDSGYVVVDEVGRPLRPEVYSDRFRRLCAVAGVQSIRLHSVRRSLAQWLIAVGVAPDAAASLLGHTTEVFRNTYLPEAGATGIQSAIAALARTRRSA